ncbi:glycine cleavage system protein H [Amycolatopsis antarctica]|uniref:Glycine cleavage system H protein n=1 Tax=Amycolatopsis antarctica TaxID=1854586 RepID=A0A263CVE5_9PSEU|nr:glycine cleavage system protein GcvH [Amycolatopsis antarctica]OZM70100.1 glycine cleavage system protein H [Amycolatopsis antarctica]
MTVPENLSYTKEHEWLSIDGDVATIGITKFAAEALGDIVFVQLPEVGAVVTAGEECGEIESTKSVSELFAPVSGEVVEVNESTSDAPEIVNSDPYEQGWLFKVRTTEVPELLDAGAYTELTQEA